MPSVRPSQGTVTDPVRERILQAARRGLSSGTLPPLGTVAREAGISRTTLYRLIPSRDELLRLLEVEPDPTARERVLTEAATLIGEHGLSGLTMDDLAARAGISRASLYRLFPSKPAVFREMVRAHAPFVPLAHALAEHAGEPPELVMPVLARLILRSVQGHVGLFRTVFFEVTGAGADAELARDLALSQTIAPLAAYVARQMAEGRLRRMHPMVALQAFAGPLIMHLLTRDVAERAFGFDTPPEAVGDELTSAWLRAMKPDEETSA